MTHNDEAIPETQLRVGRFKRRSVLAFVVAIAIVLGFVGAAAFSYYRWLHYEPRAHLHVPQGSNVGLRAAATTVFLYEPVRHHLWPLLEEEAKKDGKTTIGGRLKRIEETTGIELSAARDVIFASVDASRWIAIVGGPFATDGFVQGVHQILQKDGITSYRLQDDMLIHDSGFTIGQAEDGTLLFGTDHRIVEAAFFANDSPGRAPEQSAGALSFYLTQSAWNGAVMKLPVTTAGVGVLYRIEEISGHLGLSGSPELTVKIKPARSAEAAELAGDIKGLLAEPGKLKPFIPQGFKGLDEALAQAKVSQQGGTVYLETTWPSEAVNQGLRDLASHVRAATASVER